MRKISLKADYAFRQVMSNEKVLKHFISDVLGIPYCNIKTVRVANPFLHRWSKRQKQGILDVLAIMNDDTRINIEMQLQAQKYWKKRGLYYIARMYTDEFWLGERYDRLQRCVAIHLLDFNLLEGEKNHTIYTLKDEDGKGYDDLLEIHLIEMKKPLKEEPLSQWICLFQAESIEGLQQIELVNEGMEEAVKMLKLMSLGSNLRWQYDQYMKTIRDRIAEDEYVRDEGRAEGRAEGEAKGEAKGRAANLIENTEQLCHNMNVDCDTACQMLGITKEQYDAAKKLLE